MLICDVSLVTGFAIAFAGLAKMSNRRAILAGILLGTGSGIAFMSKGLIGPGLIGLTAMLLPFCGPNWRTSRYVTALAVAAVASLPWVFIWPIAVYERSPELFKQWFLDNNLARFVGSKAVGRPNNLGLEGDRYNFFFALPWFTWPAFPLACLAFWKERRAAWREPGVQLGVVGLVVILAVLSVSRNSRTLYGLPMLVPACLLGARGVTRITPGWTDKLRARLPNCIWHCDIGGLGVLGDATFWLVAVQSVAAHPCSGAELRTHISILAVFRGVGGVGRLGLVDVASTPRRWPHGGD